ncbi:MAG: hypothetical protein J6N76_01685 [Lachnospiraceae bacterium]|nr:hypothetical protein [Lachnospiraceae bacterium]
MKDGFLIVGTDGSRYCRIGEHLHYEMPGSRGMIRTFSGSIYDNSRYLGSYINGNIVLSGKSKISPVGDQIFAGDDRYEIDPAEETLANEIRIWFGVDNRWDALRIVLKDVSMRHPEWFK